MSVELRDAESVQLVLNCLTVANLYTGFRVGGECVVCADKRRILLARSTAVRNHSPAGFNWGYCGSGPAQLALALLLDAGLSDRVAQMFYQEFKQQIVAGWNPELNWLLKGDDLRYWIESALWAERERQLQLPERGEDE